jgi:hypothetical protein
MSLFHVTEKRHEPDPVFRLWDRARNEALRRDRLPVAAVSGPEWPGRLLVVHEADLPALANEMAGAKRVND